MRVPVSDPATAALLDLAGEVAGLRLLEVACGQGRVARELARRGATLTRLDISTALLATVARLLRSGGWFVFSLGAVCPCRSTSPPGAC